MKVDVVAEVGKRVRELRDGKPGAKVTQRELAGKAGISVSFLSMIERGERAPHLETLTKIAEALGVPLMEFFTFDADPGKLEPLYRPLVNACRKQRLSKKDLDRLVSVARTMFA